MTPEQEEEVRRALASAGPAPQLPSEVAARLDVTLARLVADRSGAPLDEHADAQADEALAPGGPARLDELERRRRRRWPRVLVAAAGVAVLAYGGGVVIEGLQVSGGDAASTAARDETFAGAGGAESEDRSAPDAPGVLPPSAGTDGGSAGSPQDAEGTSARALSTRTVRLHRDTLSQDVGRLLARTTLVDGKKARVDNARGPDSVAALVAPCAVPRVARAVGYASARLDGEPATLVLRRDTGGARVAEVYACDDPARVLATAPVRE